MKIIKPGKLQENTLYRGTCPKCGCEVEAYGFELKWRCTGVNKWESILNCPHQEVVKKSMPRRPWPCAGIIILTPITERCTELCKSSEDSN